MNVSLSLSREIVIYKPFKISSTSFHQGTGEFRHALLRGAWPKYDQERQQKAEVKSKQGRKAASKRPGTRKRNPKRISLKLFPTTTNKNPSLFIFELKPSHSYNLLRFVKMATRAKPGVKGPAKKKIERPGLT